MNRLIPLALLVGSLAACTAAQAPARHRASRVTAEPRPASPEPSWRTTPDAVFRQSEPPPEESPYYVTPPIEKSTLSNGIPVWTMRRGEDGVLAIRIVSTATPESHGVSRAFASLLPGTILSVNDIDANYRLADMFAEDRIGSGYESVQIGAMMLGTRVEGVLDTLATLLRKPTYPETSLQWYRTRRKAMLDGSTESDQTTAFRVLRQVTFGLDHPYGAPLGMSSEMLVKLTHDELMRAHQAVFAPDQITIVATGDFRKEELLPKLEKAFGDWKPDKPAAGEQRKKGAARPVQPSLREPAAATSARLIVIDRPGSIHAEVAMGAIGPAFGTPDFPALDVATDLLGSLPNSPIRKRIRDELKLSYNSSMGMPAMKGPSLLSWTGKVQRDRVAEAMRELLAASKAAPAADPAPEELVKARELSRHRFITDLETADLMSDMLVHLAALRADVAEPGRYQDKVDAVTAADVRRVAQTWLDFARWKVVIVGDWSAMRQQLSGLAWGAIELRDASGKLLSTVTP